MHERRPAGTDRTFVVAGSFARAAAPVCEGVSGDWDAQSSSVTLRLPSRCLDDGDYGAVRAVVLTERRGADIDLAPQRRDGDPAPTDWIPRG